MGKAFTTAAKQRDEIPFTIDDDEFHFDPPKLAKAMLPILDGSSGGDEQQQMAATKAMWDWLRAGLPEAEYKRLTARMDDDDDHFDIEDLVEVVRYLVSEVSGRPSTKQPAS